MKTKVVSLLLAAMCLLTFAGCQDVQEAVADVYEGAIEISSAGNIIQDWMRGIGMDLGKTTLLYDGKKVGGLRRLDISEDRIQNPEDLREYVTQNIMPEIDAGESTCTVSSDTEYGLYKIQFKTPSNEYVHYIIQVNSAYYDLWFDKQLADGEMQKKILKSLEQKLDMDDIKDFMEEIVGEFQK